MITHIVEGKKYCKELHEQNTKDFLNVYQSRQQYLVLLEFWVVMFQQKSCVAVLVRSQPTTSKWFYNGQEKCTVNVFYRQICQLWWSTVLVYTYTLV